MKAHGAAQHVWHDETDKADCTGYCDTGADAQCGADDDLRAQTSEIHPQAGGFVLACGQGVELAPASAKQCQAGDDEGQAEADVVEATISQRAQQPQHDVLYVGRVGGEIDRQ